MNQLDEQLAQFELRLIDEVGVGKDNVYRVCSTVASEMEQVHTDAIRQIENQSPVKLKHRYNELVGFQRMMDCIGGLTTVDAGLIRAQVIAQNYICFVYLKDGFFRSIQQVIPNHAVCYRCCHFLTSARIRQFRNSIAHGNWNYSQNYSSLEYWDYKEGRKENGYEKFEVYQDELNFWQTLSRGIAYSSIIPMIKRLGTTP